MAQNKTVELSVVIPLYNEADGLEAFHRTLVDAVKRAAESYEIIYCDDGSQDATAVITEQLVKNDRHVKLLCLSRNFGKENALTAGIAAARGQAVLSMDGDGQHPADTIPAFVDAWRQGARVVVGVRQGAGHRNRFKQLGTNLFYAFFKAVTGQPMIAGASDFRLMDRTVQEEFLRLTESERITRGLIDWLGFSPVFIEFKPVARVHGEPGYTRHKLFKLAVNSIVSSSPRPLYVFGYIGVLIAVAAFLLGSAVLIEQVILGDPWQWNFTGTAMLGIMVLFLVGIVLISQGLLSLYVSHIHSQSKGRPLYIVDRRKSAGLHD